MPLLETPNDGSGGGGTPLSTPAADPTVSAPAAAPATPTASPSGATTTAPEGYVPSYRLREASEAAERRHAAAYAAKEAAAEVRYREMERKFQALAGFTPPPDPEVSAVKGQFGTIYPGLVKLEERAADIERLIERAGDLESQTQHYWQTYGRQTMDKLFGLAQESLGAPLNDEGKRQLHAAFTGFVQSSPELTSRYANDPSIVEDFFKQFTSSFIDPVRRAASATVVGRVAGNIPQDTPGGAPRATPIPSGGSLDDRVATAWAAFNQAKTGGGV